MSGLRKSFVNNSLALIKLSKTQLSRMVQARGILPFSSISNPENLTNSIDTKINKGFIYRIIKK